MAGTSVDLGPLAVAFRTRLWLYEPRDGSPALSQSLAGGLSANGPPDDALYPLGVYRLLNLSESRGYAGSRSGAMLEVFLFHRPRSAWATVEALADTAAEAVTTYRDIANGVHLCTLTDRDTMPPFSEAADPEVVQVRLVFALVLYPAS